MIVGNKLEHKSSLLSPFFIEFGLNDIVEGLLSMRGSLIERAFPKIVLGANENEIFVTTWKPFAAGPYGFDVANTVSNQILKILSEALKFVPLFTTRFGGFTQVIRCEYDSVHTNKSLQFPKCQYAYKDLFDANGITINLERDLMWVSFTN